jgi:(p)ppGpp synthase/HD superfamily hydrolase
VRTERARAKIRTWFRKQNREKNIQTGRDVLEREMKRLGLLDSMAFDTVFQWFGFDKLDDFLAAVGASDITAAQITNRILDKERKDSEALERETLKAKPSSNGVAVDSSNGISIQGTSGLLVNLAKCCNPMPGEPIVGYVTRGRGVTVHRMDCPNIQGADDAERLIDVTWGRVKDEQRYSVPVEIIAYDREGLMRDISTIIADEKVNMSTVQVATRQNIATFQLTMELADLQQLARVLTRIECIPSVVEARRRNTN